MARSRTVFRCSSCGAPAPKWAGRCPTCDDWNTLVEELDDGPISVASLVPVTDPVPITRPDQRRRSSRRRPASTSSTGCSAAASFPAASRCSAASPGSASRPWCCNSWRRGLAPAARCCTSPARSRSSRCGCGPSGSGALHPRAAPGRRDDAAQRARPHRGAPARHLRRRLGPDPARPGLLLRAGVGGPGPGVRTPAGPGRQGSRRDDGAGRPRHQGRPTGRPPGARAHRRHGPVLRGRPPPRPSTRPGREAPVRRRPTSSACSRLGERGLEPVPDPSGLFLGDRRSGVAGSVVTPAMEGHRPLLVEVQALVADSTLAQPRRSVHGLDGGRVALLLAVLSRRVGVPVGALDVYAMAVGGVRVMEPGADLGDRAGGRLLVVGRGPARGTGGLRRGGPRRRAPSGRPARDATSGRGGPARFPPAAVVPRTAPDVARRHRGAAGPEPRRRRRPVRPAEVAVPRRPTRSSDPPRLRSMPDRDSQALMTRWPSSLRAQPLREGLDRILKASMGALIVVGDGPEVLNICSGGFLLDAAFSPQRLSELAKTDGAIILARDAEPHRPRQRAPGARTRTCPPTRPGPVTAPPSGSPARSACPSSPCREDMAVLTVYMHDAKHQLDADPVDPEPLQPGAADPRAVQGAAQRGVDRR